VRRTFAWAVAGALLILAVALLVVLVTRGHEASGGPTATTGSPGPVVTSPYDFTEADAPVDFNGFADAKFISLTLETPGGVKSYLLARDSAGFATLISAFATARETVVPGPPPGQTTLPEPAGGTPTSGSSGATGQEAAGAGDEEVGPSLTVVMADRTTYTFALDLEGNVLVRGTQAWRLQGDLKTLVESATAE
jgi:hypothetical protein